MMHLCYIKPICIIYDAILKDYEGLFKPVPFPWMVVEGQAGCSAGVPPGGQAEYVRVPYSDVGPIVIPEGVEDEKVLFLSDILPTGWMAADNCEIEPGDVVAVWGCGPVGLFAVQSAFALGAHRVIAIDHHPHRLDLAKSMGAEVINFEEVRVREALVEMTGGIGPDACIDAVGMESHGFSIDDTLDHVKAAVGLATDRPHALSKRTRVSWAWERNPREAASCWSHKIFPGQGPVDSERSACAFCRCYDGQLHILDDVTGDEHARHIRGFIPSAANAAAAIELASQRLGKVRLGAAFGVEKESHPR